MSVLVRLHREGAQGKESISAEGIPPSIREFTSHTNHAPKIKWCRKEHPYSKEISQGLSVGWIRHKAEEVPLLCALNKFTIIIDSF